MIAHLSYVMCDECGNPADPANNATEARAAARCQGFIREAGHDVCPFCVEPRSTDTPTEESEGKGR